MRIGVHLYQWHPGLFVKQLQYQYKYPEKSDEHAIRQYCRQRYHYQRMLEKQRKQDTEQQPAPIYDIINMLEKAVTQKSWIVKDLAIRNAGEWTHELATNYSYLGSLKKKLYDALAKVSHLNFEQKQKAWELV